MFGHFISGFLCWSNFFYRNMWKGFVFLFFFLQNDRLLLFCKLYKVYGWTFDLCWHTNYEEKCFVRLLFSSPLCVLFVSFFFLFHFFFVPLCFSFTHSHMYFLAQMKVRRHISLTWNAFFFELKVLESHKDINHTRPLLWNELEVSHVCTLHLRAQGALWNNQLHGWGKASSILPSLKILNFSCSSIFFSSNVSLLSSLSPASSLLPIILLALPLSSSFLSFLSLLLLLGSEPQRCRACR